MFLPITIKPLTPALLTDYFAFFDHQAFTDNPRWASCFCFFPHAPHATEKWSERTGPQNRRAVSERVAAGTQQGYLAFAGEKAVGWCNAGRRSTFTMLDIADEPGQPPVGAIVCFVVAPAYRSQGVAAQLLDAVCEGFRRQGIMTVEAYPRITTSNAAQNHTGPLAMYLKAGFVQVEENDGTATVRKELA
jgi:GNAT superfamily N-acetyltransferase